MHFQRAKWPSKWLEAIPKPSLRQGGRTKQSTPFWRQVRSGIMRKPFSSESDFRANKRFSNESHFRANKRFSSEQAPSIARAVVDCRVARKLAPRNDVLGSGVVGWLLDLRVDRGELGVEFRGDLLLVSFLAAACCLPLWRCFRSSSSPSSEGDDVAMARRWARVSSSRSCLAILSCPHVRRKRPSLLGRLNLAACEFFVGRNHGLGAELGAARGLYGPEILDGQRCCG